VNTFESFESFESHEIWNVIFVCFTGILQLSLGLGLCIVTLLLPLLPFSFLNFLHLLPGLFFLWGSMTASAVVFVGLVDLVVHNFGVIMQIPPS